MASSPRLSARGAARRLRILEAALEVVRDAPVADVQLKAVAERAEVRPSHVLYYFGSRDGVLVAAVTHAEQRLAEGRAERLRAIEDPAERLLAFTREYLPDDAQDPVWKLWFEGWLRSASRADFRAVGDQADAGWHADLTESLEYAAADGAQLADTPAIVARRFLFLLDGLAVHVLSGRHTVDDAAAIADAALRTWAVSPPRF